MERGRKKREGKKENIGWHGQEDNNRNPYLNINHTGTVCVVYYLYTKPSIRLFKKENPPFNSDV